MTDLNRMMGVDYFVEYRLEYHYGPSFTFTDSGHVDMEAFDERDADDHFEVLAVFHDEETERLFRTLHLELDEHHKKIHAEDSSIYECDEVEVTRNEISKAKATPWEPDIKWWWENIACIDGGFDPDEYGWDATDKDGNPFDWESDDLLKQAPKLEDFIKVCNRHFNWRIDLTSYSGFSFQEIRKNFSDDAYNVMTLMKDIYYFGQDDIGY